MTGSDLIPKPRPQIIDVPPEWLRPRKGDGDALRRAKRRVTQQVTAKLADSDWRMVLAGKLAQVE